MKRLLCAILALTFLFAIGTCALAEEDGQVGENLIENGDFSTMDGELPEGWRRELWLTDAGVSVLTVEEDGYEGRCVSVTNVDANDARFVQTVPVEPNTLYRVSGMVRAEDCDPEGYGASLSIGNVFVYSEALYDTHGRWEYVELYGWTGADQTELDIFARVGGYGNLSRGRAWFDNIALSEVAAAPADVFVYDFYRNEGGDSSESFAAEEASDGEPERFTEAWLLFTAIYALAVLGFVRKRNRAASAWYESRPQGALILLLAGAMLLRLIVALRVPGYNTDINCFSAWSERIFSSGLTRFYDPNYFCDYPPGYILLLWPVALLRRALGLGTGTAAYRAILKLLPMLADVAGACLLYRAARKHISERGALLLAALYALNPATIANSAAWGQIDAVLTLLIVLCALSAIEYHYVRALLWFAAALLVKPQALLFAPLGLVAMLAGIVRAEDAQARRQRLVRFLLGTLACLAILYASALLFSMNQPAGEGSGLLRPVSWMVNLYSGTMQGYRYMTVNTLNLHCLLGLNWGHMEQHPVISAAAWALFAAGYIYTAALCWWNARKPHRLLLLGGTLIMLISAFGPMMHERYVFPAMLLLALAFVWERDRRILIGLTALTCTLFLNEVLVLQGGMTAANFGHLQSSENWLNGLLSLIVVLNALFMAWTAFDICVRERVIGLSAAQPEAEPIGLRTFTESAGYKLNLKRMDYLLMAGLTAVYSVVAFTNLGVTKAPESGWTSSVAGEAVVFDLGDVETFRMSYYGGICNSNFTVALSNDGENWTDEVYAKYNQGEIFRWLWFVPLNESDGTLYEGDVTATEDGVRFNTASAGESYPLQTARYVRIAARSAGLVLYEVGFQDANGETLPVANVTQQGQLEDTEPTAEQLIDEQDTIPDRPSHLNSSYFDEIYHARTAYEHLHGMNTYEWTHPPLGKVWMMLGVALFGMTPFGWRFMGTLAGVLMLPLIYLLVKQLTKDTKLSAIAMALMALDSMHFTQTRIATIDSFAVFWIMVMYLFMFRYCQMSWYREGLGRTLVPLGLCGVTMGVAWATKWIGIYAAAGLAVLFFWTLYRRLRERPYIQGDDRTWRNVGITVAFCIVFFIVVPLTIYYFSYYWHLRGEGLSGFGGMFSLARVRRVIEIQKNMFNYHSGLGGDTHYFRSSWYQWPVIWWPMWYYSGTGYLTGDMVSSISCMGNPAVWWFGLVAIVYVFARVCWDRRASRSQMIVIIGFASQFLPWVLVPRSTYIYHYFASVPFIIMASVLLLRDIRRRSRTAFDVTTCVLLASAAALFGMFYPLESGLPAPRSYVQHLRWFKWYNY